MGLFSGGFFGGGTNESRTTSSTTTNVTTNTTSKMGDVGVTGAHAANAIKNLTQASRDITVIGGKSNQAITQANVDIARTSNQTVRSLFAQSMGGLRTLADTHVKTQKGFTDKAFGFLKRGAEDLSKQVKDVNQRAGQDYARLINLTSETSRPDLAFGKNLLIAGVAVGLGFIIFRR